MTADRLLLLTRRLAAAFMADLSCEIDMAEAEPISYILSFPSPQTHYAEVEASVPARAAEEIELMMAVWTPGSYLVREYSRHVERVSAWGNGGAPLKVRKSRKNRWTVRTGGAGRATLRYRVYCHDMSVRGNWVESSFAMLNGAPTFLTLQGDNERPHDVLVRLPEGWERIVTALPAAPGGSDHRYRAENFDTLVDSPLVAGNPAVYEFQAGGRAHSLVNVGEEGIWDGPRSAADVEKIVREHQALWGAVPYERYVFFNLITEASGGLEHRNSSVLMTSRWKSRIRKAYLEWLGLVSHEFFHTWNVTRLRPVELGPFDYESEAYTRSLWIAEGITNYYTDLLVCRAGLCSETEYLEKLSRLIERLETTPGRRVQSLEDSSFDAWVKLYRPDENTANTTISYYIKGAIVAFLLDAIIRRATEGARSLDDVMRLAYERYSGRRGFTGEEYCDTAQEVAGTESGRWFDMALRSTEDLSYDEALDWFGLQFKETGASGNDGSSSSDAGGGDGEDRESRGNFRPKAWLGIDTRKDLSRLVVSRVRRESPAERFGVNVGDEIVAVDDFVVRAEDWEKRLEQYRPGDEVSLLVARRQKLTRLGVTFGETPPDRWKLEVRADASPEQKERYKSWLTGQKS